MKKAAKAGIGVVAVLAICVVALYADIRLGLKADQEACPAVQPSEAARAVVQDVIRPSNQIFAKYHLTTSDVMVDMSGIQISSATVLVPFRITKEPEKQFFGMPRCSVLSDVEYAND